MRGAKQVMQYLLWLAVLFVPFELYVRAAGLGAMPRLRVHDSGRFLVPVPESRVVYRREGFSSFRFNRDGLRGAPLPWEPAEGEVRFAFLGDSFTLAMQVATDETFVERFAARVRSNLPGATTLNFGQPHLGLATHVVRYRHLVRPRRPDVVVLVATDSDLHDLMREVRSPASRWTGDDVVVDTERLEWNDPSTEASFRLQMALRQALDSYVVLQRAGRLVDRLRSGSLAQPAYAAEASAPRVPPGAVALYASVLGRLRAEVARDGAVLVGVHISDGFTVREGDRTYVRALEQAFARAGVPFVTSFEALRALYREGRWPHWGQPHRTGGHLTPAGHEALTEVMIEALRRGPWADAVRSRLRRAE